MCDYCRRCGRRGHCGALEQTQLHSPIDLSGLIHEPVVTFVCLLFTQESGHPPIEELRYLELAYLYALKHTTIIETTLNLAKQLQKIKSLFYQAHSVYCLLPMQNLSYAKIANQYISPVMLVRGMTIISIHHRTAF